MSHPPVDKCHFAVDKQPVMWKKRAAAISMAPLAILPSPLPTNDPHPPVHSQTATPPPGVVAPCPPRAHI